MVVWKAPDVLSSEIAISAEHFMQMQTNDKCRKQVRNMAKKRIGNQWKTNWTAEWKKNKAKPRRTAKQREQFINKVKKREKIENDTQSNKRKRKTKLLWWKKGSRYIGIKCNAWLCKLLSFILRLFFSFSLSLAAKNNKNNDRSGLYSAQCSLLFLLLLCVLLSIELCGCK